MDMSFLRLLYHNCSAIMTSWPSGRLLPGIKSLYHIFFHFYSTIFRNVCNLCNSSADSLPLSILLHRAPGLSKLYVLKQGSQTGNLLQAQRGHSVGVIGIGLYLVYGNSYYMIYRALKLHNPSPLYSDIFAGSYPHTFVAAWSFQTP